MSQILPPPSPESLEPVPVRRRSPPPPPESIEHPSQLPTRPPGRRGLLGALVERELGRKSVP